jgi:hypothetical protein
VSHSDSNLYRGVFRQTSISPCVISIRDLRRLYAELGKMAKDALDRHIEGMTRPADTAPEDWNARKAEIRRMGGLTLLVVGSNGEQSVDQSALPLEADQLPDRVSSVVLDSSSSLQRAGVVPLNRFQVNLDFTEPPNFGDYDPWNSSTPNGSRLEVTGADNAWATGVYEYVLGFIRARRRRRGWLHSQAAFNFLNWTIGFPAAFWIVYRISSAQSEFFEAIDAVIRGAIYIYITLVVLLIFRGIIAAFRWTFPVVELEGARSSAVRGIVNAAMSSLLLALVYDILKTLVWK